MILAFFIFYLHISDPHPSSHPSPPSSPLPLTQPDVITKNRSQHSFTKRIALLRLRNIIMFPSLDPDRCLASPYVYASRLKTLNIKIRCIALHTFRQIAEEGNSACFVVTKGFCRLVFWLVRYGHGNSNIGSGSRCGSAV